MTPRPTAESPATEAGRRMFREAGESWDYSPSLEAILAIEAEAAALSDSARLRLALKNLSVRHEWQPDAGPCICFAHIEARALLAQPTKP